ncbi:uncharacterized protein ARMOST_03430 [Armillaria ostoyae]|uniref:Reverse transcriptase domain-containing protein n=1 Tax=Armillaria ostoyae TaxID=47428 RepID=A0A284QUF5_ARMOS|nr:uncharacterized protein ARMOST_03430 [Armillaria ostoyae]
MEEVKAKWTLLRSIRTVRSWTSASKDKLSSIDHAIELVSNAQATLNCKVYPLNRSEQEELDKFLEENLATGHIKPSKSPMASPFFFVKKKDGKLCPVQDYHKLNEMTIKNCYPLPLISELMDKLGSAKYFTKLDI